MRKSAIVLCIALATAVFAPAQQQPADSCRKFVEGFYASYFPRLLKTPNLSILTLKKTPELFAPALREALQKDFAAQAKVHDDIIGIDYDLFLGGQDFAKSYNVRKVEIRNGLCFAEVWGKWPPIAGQKPSAAPDVIAELKQNGDTWQFVNFSYPELKFDLLGNLAELAKEREKEGQPK